MIMKRFFQFLIVNLFIAGIFAQDSVTVSPLAATAGMTTGTCAYTFTVNLETAASSYTKVGVSIGTINYTATAVAGTGPFAYTVKITFQPFSAMPNLVVYADSEFLTDITFPNMTCKYAATTVYSITPEFQNVNIPSPTSTTCTFGLTVVMLVPTGVIAPNLTIVGSENPTSVQVSSIKLNNANQQKYSLQLSTPVGEMNDLKIQSSTGADYAMYFSTLVFPNLTCGTETYSFQSIDLPIANQTTVEDMDCSFVFRVTFVAPNGVILPDPSTLSLNINGASGVSAGAFKTGSRDTDNLQAYYLSTLSAPIGTFGSKFTLYFNNVAVAGQGTSLPIPDFQCQLYDGPIGSMSSSSSLKIYTLSSLIFLLLLLML